MWHRIMKREIEKVVEKNNMTYLGEQRSRSLGRLSEEMERMRISGLKARMVSLYNLKIFN